jgi:hypothetical protein
MPMTYFTHRSDQAQIDFDNEGGETYICGNPPYRGSKWQTAEQKADLSNACKPPVRAAAYL